MVRDRRHPKPLRKRAPVTPSRPTRCKPKAVCNPFIVIDPGGFDVPPNSVHSAGYVRFRHRQRGMGRPVLLAVKRGVHRRVSRQQPYGNHHRRNKRDHVWIMVRTPNIPQAGYKILLACVARPGYPLSSPRCRSGGPRTVAGRRRTLPEAEFQGGRRIRMIRLSVSPQASDS